MFKIEILSILIWLKLCFFVLEYKKGAEVSI